MASSPLDDTTAVILAGGLGTRLRSVVADRPKVLAEVAGRPFLAHLLDQLVPAGIGHVVLCTGHLGEQIESAFGSSYRGMRVTCSREPTPLGTAGALRFALPHVSTGTLLVLNGDSYCAADPLAFAARHRSLGLDGTLLLVEVPDTSRYGLVRTDPQGRLAGFEEKGSHTGTGWINAGWYLLQRTLIEAVPPDRAVSFERDMLPQWTDGRIGTFPCRVPFLDIGLPETYAQTEAFLASLSPPSPGSEPRARSA